MSNETAINAIRARLDRPLVLVGMPASGKTALGLGLARVLGLDFTDLDMAIEQQAGRTITAIFEEEGEARFRDLESAMIARHLENSAGPCVISTGGGAVLRPANRDLLFGHGHAIWVKASIPVLLERASRNANRPLLKNQDPEKTLRELAAARTEFYCQAPITVETDRRPPTEIIDEIVTKIYERLS